MIEKTSSFSRFFTGCSRLCHCRLWSKNGRPTVGAFFTCRFHSYDRLTFASLA